MIWRRVIKRAALFLLLLMLFLSTAYISVETGNAVADLVSVVAFLLLILWGLILVISVLLRIFPKGAGIAATPSDSREDGDVWMYYPPVYRKVPFGSVIVIFVMCAYIIHVRLSLPEVQARGMEEEAATAALVFLMFSMIWTLPVFVWIYSAFYRLTSEGFQWMAPWSRKRFVRWDEIISVWYTPQWGKGIWVRTYKGRFRIDYDMVNAHVFVKYVLEHASKGRGLDLLR